MTLSTGTYDMVKYVNYTVKFMNIPYRYSRVCQLVEIFIQDTKVISFLYRIQFKELSRHKDC